MRRGELILTGWMTCGMSDIMVSSLQVNGGGWIGGWGEDT